MLTVDDHGTIRRAFRDGMSIREIARTFGHSRRKIRQVLAEPQPKSYTRTKPPPAPVLGSFHGILVADEDAPSKQRHTAMQVYRGLRFGMVLNPQWRPEVYLEGTITRQDGLSREHQGPRAVLNAVERLARGYGTERARVEQDLGRGRSRKEGRVLPNLPSRSRRSRPRRPSTPRPSASASAVFPQRSRSPAGFCGRRRRFRRWMRMDGSSGWRTGVAGPGRWGRAGRQSTRMDDQRPPEHP